MTPKRRHTHTFRNLWMRPRHVPAPRAGTVDGWFPQIAADHRVTSGSRGIWITDPGAAARQVSPVGIGPVWAGPVLVFNQGDGTTAVGPDVVPAAYNDSAGSDDDRWAGFVASGDGRTDVYRGKQCVSATETICAARFGGSKFAYLTPYQADARNLVLDNVVVAHGRIADVQLSRGGEFYVYLVATGTYTRQILDAPGVPVNLRDDEVPLVAFVGPNGEAWMLTGTAEAIAFVRPVYSVEGYRIDGDLYYPDARMVDGRLHVVGSSGAGAPREIWIDFTAARQDLRPTAPPIEPPIEPPVEPPVEPPIEPPVEPVEPVDPPPVTPPTKEPRMIAYGPPLLDFKPGEEHDNGNGTVSIQKPNGQWLAVTPTGSVEERPTPGGVWESFRRGPNGYLAEREGPEGEVLVYVLPFVEA